MAMFVAGMGFSVRRQMTDKLSLDNCGSITLSYLLLYEDPEFSRISLCMRSKLENMSKWI